MLWPPNDKMVTVSVAAQASDACSGGATTCRITAVSSSDRPNGDNRCDRHEQDFRITGPLTVSLRAERSGHGSGRTYTITVQCTDPSGNSSVATTTVSVPHDMGRDKDRDDDKDKDKKGRERRD